jgi:hypothetical protein
MSKGGGENEAGKSVGRCGYFKGGDPGDDITEVSKHLAGVREGAPWASGGGAGDTASAKTLGQEVPSLKEASVAGEEYKGEGTGLKKKLGWLGGTLRTSGGLGLGAGWGGVGWGGVWKAMLAAWSADCRSEVGSDRLQWSSGEARLGQCVGRRDLTICFSEAGLALAGRSS